MRAATMIAAVGLSLSLVTLTAFAQEGPAPHRTIDGASFEQAPRGEKGPGKRMNGLAKGELFETIDANGDGLVSEEEVQAVKEERQATREARVAERAQNMAEKALETFDANADGVLDAGELETMFASRAGQKGKGAKGARGGQGKKGGPGRAMKMLGEEALAQFDTDNDGKVSRDEAQAQREEIRAALEAKKAELQSRFDLDGDGALSDDERKTLRATVGAERRVARADLNRDGVLDADELRGATELIDDLDPRADFNGDGVVDKSDYETLVKMMPSL